MSYWVRNNTVYYNDNPVIKNSDGRRKPVACSTQGPSEQKHMKN